VQQHHDRGAHRTEHPPAPAPQHRPFGYGAKTLGRVLRMQRALALARGGVRPADAAARAGYADQSHLARDVKEMAGVPLGALIS
jgi:AraC-like DNA-binding protein